MSNKSIFSTLLLLSALLTITINAQQFILEATVEKRMEGIFDIDGDGICEYITDTNKVYDGVSHTLKYTINGDPVFSDEQFAQNPYSQFPHIDFNGDGIREIVTDGNMDYNPGVFDLANGQPLFEFNPAGEGDKSFEELVDIDGILEIIFLHRISQEWPTPDIYNTYIYSTGVQTTAIKSSKKFSPKNFDISQNYPNPSTTIEYKISIQQSVKIDIYDVTGQLVKRLINANKKAGSYSIVWNGKDDYGNKVASGNYFYQIVSGDFAQAKKMILLK